MGKQLNFQTGERLGKLVGWTIQDADKWFTSDGCYYMTLTHPAAEYPVRLRISVDKQVITSGLNVHFSGELNISSADIEEVL